MDEKRSWGYKTFRFVLLSLLVSLHWLHQGVATLNLEPDHVYRDQPERGEMWAEHLSSQPRIILWHNFLRHDECDHLINLAAPHMHKTVTVDSVTGKPQIDKARTSTGMFLTYKQDDVVRRIEERIAKYTMIPIENGEDLQVLRYDKEQFYRPHMDFFHDNASIQTGGQRLATMLMYLSDVEEGGETVFTNLPPSSVTGEDSGCAERGIAVKPQKGNAVFFYSLLPDSEKDLASLHGGCPVLQGVKWSATKWLRQKEILV